VSPRGGRILLAGATGLVGSRVLQALLAAPGFTGCVVAPTRRALGLEDPRLLAPVCDFNAVAADAELAAATRAANAVPLDAYVCCLGTTLRAAGSREAFLAVDRELVRRLAELARGLGARHAIVVSSVGASRQSGNFYLRVKGEVEDALEHMGFSRLDILQPGLLIGPRSERRPAEAIAQRLAPLADALLPGRLRRYRSLDADVVARAIVRLLGETAPGVFAHTHDAIVGLGAASAR
jgi:uncharacterized protein YbjT (DUF2867 family)